MTTFNDHSPIYRQIATQIEAEIVNGALGPDEQIMSTNQYATFYRINPATAAKAFQELVDEGLLYKKRGIGMFVSADACERLRERRRGQFAANVLRPMVIEALAIGIPIADVIQNIETLAKEEQP